MPTCSRAGRHARFSMGNSTHARWLLVSLLLWLPQSSALASSIHRGDFDFDEFPDALSVEAACGTFVNLSINGSVLSGNGCHIQIRNTSWGDGFASSFERDPEDDFRGPHGGLSPIARAAIGSGQPYGIYELELELPVDSTLISAPSFLDFEHEREHGGGSEIELEIDLDKHPRYLLFDSEAENIPDVFRDAQTGTWELFLSIASSNSSSGNGLPPVHVDEIEVEAAFAWEEDGAVTDEFGDNWRAIDGEELEVEVTIIPAQVIPEPSTALLLALGLGALARYARPRHPASARRQPARA